jgi:hypothetical protein
LNVVSRLSFLRFLGVQRLLVSVEGFHHSKLCLADTNNDHRKGIFRALNQLVVGLIDVKDLSICQNDQDIVSLVVLRLLILFGSTVIISLLQNTGKVSWTEEPTLMNGALISSDAPFNSLDFGVVDISIKSETVTY